MPASTSFSQRLFRHPMPIALVTGFTMLIWGGLLHAAPAGLEPADAPSALTTASYGKPELRYAWRRTMWAFRTPAERSAYLRDRLYTKAPLHGVKVDAQGRVFVTIARLMDGRVPASLNRIVMRSGQPMLQPFPDWDSNRLGRPGALQNVLGMEIDSRNRLWALDMGFAGGTEAPASDAEQKIVVIDLDTDQVLQRFPLPTSVADPSTSFLNDMALDEPNQRLYISDTGLRSGDGAASGIIVYDLRQKRARRVLHRAPSTRDDPEHPLVVDGEAVLPSQPLRAGINGITLSPDGSRLYWSLTTGDAVYAIDTRYLNDPALSDEEIGQHVEGPRRIGGGSDALTADSRGRVYITNVSRGEVQVMMPGQPGLSVIASGRGFMWPDTFGWDRDGGLWVSTNQLNRVFAGQADFDGKEPNFRIYRIQTDAGKGHVLPATQATVTSPRR